MVTIKDVAREAGVSLGTVSNVLNGLPSVSLQNREKVMNAVDKLHYQPLTHAPKALSTNSVGLIIPDINNPYYPELARGAEDAAMKNGCTVLLCNNDRNTDKERKYVDILLDKGVEGIIMVKPRMTPEEIARLGGKCAFVLVDNGKDAGGPYDIINVDEIDGMTAAMSLLYDYGHRRIAFISGLLESESSRMRLKAYSDFLNARELCVESELIKTGAYNWYSGYACATELLRAVEPPTAIFAANDLMAIGAMRAARERRMRIPHDVSIMGIDDIEMAQLTTPQLTTVRQPKYEIGAAAVDLLVKRIRAKAERRAYPAQLITLKAEIMLRESVGYANPNTKIHLRREFEERTP